MSEDGQYLGISVWLGTDKKNRFFYRDLKAKGVTFQQEPKDMPWKHRVAVLRDPEGRMVMLAQLSPR